MIDQFMIGQLGEQSIAAVGLASRPAFIFFFIIQGLASGGAVFFAQFWGKGETRNMGQVLSSIFLVGLVFVVLFSIQSIVFPSETMLIFSKDEEVIRLGVEYQLAVAWGFLPQLIVMGYSAMLRSCGNVTLPLYTGFLKVLLNTFLNYVLIFGNLGFPAMGVYGAALATALAHFLEMIVFLAVVYGKNMVGSFTIRQFNIQNKDLFQLFLFTSIPLVIGELSWAFGETVYTVIYGQMGTQAMASISIVFPVMALSVGFFTGLSNSAAIMLGNQLGAGDDKKTYQNAMRFIRLAASFSAIMGFICIALARLYLSVYEVSEQVKEDAYWIIVIFALYISIKVSNMTIGQGILRSGGDTQFTTKLGIIGSWLLGVPIGFISAFYFKLSIVWVYTLLSTEEIFRVILVYRRVVSKKWIKNLVKEF
ncbi:MAG: MATE family efflux transporter [Flammeovirgaceae bacterium]